MRRRHGDEPARHDVRRELDSHLRMRIDELVAGGVDPRNARERARSEFGNYDRIAGECRHIAGSPDSRTFTQMLDSLRQDLTFAWRTLRRSPGFVLASVATLGLGIGANTAIFSVLDSVLLQPLPYPEPERLVAVWERPERGNDSYVAAANFLDWERMSTSFEALSLMPTYRFGGRSTVLGGDEPARVWIGSVSPSFFRVMDVHPLLGRPFAATDGVEGAERVAIVSHRLWRDLLGEPEDLTSTTLEFYNGSWTIVGVMPPGFSFPAETDIWTAAGRSPLGHSRTSHNWATVGRLRDGVDLRVAHEELDTITAALRLEHADDMDAVGANVYPLHEELLGSTRRPLMLVLWAAAMVLLVACTNIASSLLARATGRRQEIAIRSSLGAGSRRLVRQLLTESVLLALAGAVAGTAIAGGTLRVLLALSPALPRSEAIGLDATALTFALALTLLTALIFGLAPAIRLARGATAGALRAGTHGDAGSSRAWSALVAAEVALALVLLIGSALLLRSFWNVLGVDAGFRHQGVLTVEVAIPSPRYADDAAVASYFEQALGALESVPGALSTGLINHLPLGGARINGGFDIEGQAPRTGASDYRVVGGDYFDALGIPLLAGRTFSAADGADAEPVVIVNQALAERFFGDESPVGLRIGNLANDAFVYGDEWMRVVGIVGNVRHRGLTRGATPEVYVHYLQRPMRARGARLVLRTDSEPTALISAARERLRRVDDQVPTDFAPMTDLVTGSVAARRFTATVIGAFAIVALSLAAVGISSVVGYTVARRRREIGIRLALGAAPDRVRSQVVLGSMRPVVGGCVIGLAASLALGRVLSSSLFAITPSDPLTLAAAALALATVAAVASYVSARRSTTIDPLMTMRAE